MIDAHIRIADIRSASSETKCFLLNLAKLLFTVALAWFLI